MRIFACAVKLDLEKNYFEIELSFLGITSWVDGNKVFRFIDRYFL